MFIMRHIFIRAVVVGLIACALHGPLLASDHSDLPQLGNLGRNDARITDLHAFRRGHYLVVAMSLNPAVPPSVQEYIFSSDLVVEFHIDNKSAVSFADPQANAVMGGTIVKPDKIKDHIVLTVTFDQFNQPRLKAKGLSTPALRDSLVYAGLRDDPFIRGPRIGRNVAAIVIAIPLSEVLHRQPELLIWGTTDVPETAGKIDDHAGRSLRSMFPENDAMNYLHPSDHLRRMGVVPDVMIYDTSRPAVYPNGRELADDVVDLVGDSRVLGNDAPFPSENDVPFLSEFPYLAPRHPAP